MYVQHQKHYFYLEAELPSVSIDEQDHHHLPNKLRQEHCHLPQCRDTRLTNTNQYDALTVLVYAHSHNYLGIEELINCHFCYQDIYLNSYNIRKLMIHPDNNLSINI